MEAVIVGDGPFATAIRHHLREVPFVWFAEHVQAKDGHPDYQPALAKLHDLLGSLARSNVVISSQFPVGTCRSLEAEYPQHAFAVVPENVRAAHAVDDFVAQDRFVVGARNSMSWDLVCATLAPFAPEFVLVTPETAEFSKHCLNGFLSLSIVYANEIAALATKHGADPDDVARCLMTDSRIGPKAYLEPGPGLSEHLRREVSALVALGGGPLLDRLEETTR